MFYLKPYCKEPCYKEVPCVLFLTTFIGDVQCKKMALFQYANSEDPDQHVILCSLLRACFSCRYSVVSFELYIWQQMPLSDCLNVHLIRVFIACIWHNVPFVTLNIFYRYLVEEICSCFTLFYYNLYHG